MYFDCNIYIGEVSLHKYPLAPLLLFYINNICKNICRNITSRCFHRKKEIDEKFYADIKQSTGDK